MLVSGNKKRGIHKPKVKGRKKVKRKEGVSILQKASRVAHFELHFLREETKQSGVLPLTDFVAAATSNKSFLSTCNSSPLSYEEKRKAERGIFVLQLTWKNPVSYGF
ncbi:hypothetical protein TNIN_289991 [Trichonephila inaurata madagascariensis]|uniref:Uncharacterized protein n=1 Tax=Trichonephila inaurata madagascariensis TaxID=2747483 RepID=A0A8X6I6Y1_9ARAC|nr:hypothetical protein TNIN_289991 [Trichonephila inaurata madagascariensis]